MKRASIAILGVFIAVSVWGSGFSPREVAGDAKWVVHADLAQARSTRLGEFVMNEIEQSKARKKLDAAKAMFRFDFCKDIQNVTVYGPADGSEDGVMLIDGNFDRDHLLTLLESNESHKVLEDQGYSIHSWTNKHPRCKSKAKMSYGSFAADGTLVLSDRKDLIVKALGVLDGYESSLNPNCLLNLGGFDNAAFMAAAMDMRGNSKVPSKAAILRQSDSMQFSVREVGGNLKARMVLETQDEETALNVDAVARGMLAMALLHQEDSPGLAELAQKVRILTQGTSVTIKFSCPVDKIIDLYLSKKIDITAT